MQSLPLLLTPLPYLAAFVFLVVTSLHQEWEVLAQIHLELLVTAAALGAAAVSLIAERRALDRARVLTLICLVLIGAPLVSSLANNGFLGVVDAPEYRSWVKMLCVAPAIYLFCSGKSAERFLDVIFLSNLVFAGVFLYRFFVLGEAREYDARPLLQWKNGDPNFMCLIFAAPIPLVLYRISSWRISAKKQIARHVFLAAVFLFCAVVTESRMGLLSIAAAFGYLLRRMPRSMQAAALVLGAGLFYGGISERFAHVADASNYYRVKSMIAGFELFTTSPFFGHGWDSGMTHFFEVAGYPRFLSETPPLNVHNTPLQLLAELGFYGLAAYTALIVFTLREIRANPHPIAVYSLASLIIVLMNLMTLPLQSKDFVLLLVVSLAALNASPEPRS